MDQQPSSSPKLHQGERPPQPLTIEEQCTRDGGQTPTEGEFRQMIATLNSTEGCTYLSANPGYVAFLMQWLLEQVYKYRNTDPGQGKTLRTPSGESSCHYNREYELTQLWKDKAGDYERVKKQLDEAHAVIEELEAQLAALRQQVRV